MQDIYTVDFSAGNVTLTSTQFRSAYRFVPSGLSTTRSLILPAVKRAFFVVDNTDSADTITVTKGATTVSVGPGQVAYLTTDGTTDGLRGTVIVSGAFANPTESIIIIAAGDETTAITTGTGKVTFWMPYALRDSRLCEARLRPRRHRARPSRSIST